MSEVELRSYRRNIRAWGRRKPSWLLLHKSKVNVSKTKIKRPAEGGLLLGYQVDNAGDEIRELGDECLNLRTTCKTNSATRYWFIEEGVAFLSR